MSEHKQLVAILHLFMVVEYARCVNRYDSETNIQMITGDCECKGQSKFKFWVKKGETRDTQFKFRNILVVPPPLLGVSVRRHCVLGNLFICRTPHTSSIFFFSGISTWQQTEGKCYSCRQLTYEILIVCVWVCVSVSAYHIIIIMSWLMRCSVNDLGSFWFNADT